MTRKHFELIASAMKETKPEQNWLNKYLQWTYDVEALVRAFTQVNERFDADKFREACGYEWNCK